MSRYYEANGVLVPSVTTVIHILGSDYLLKWANSMGFKRIDSTKYTEERAKFGTLAHDLVRTIVDKNFISESVITDSLLIYQLNKSSENFQKWLATIKYETISTEQCIVDAENGYGGTLDWLCMSDGKLTMYDFKTSKQFKNTMLLQLGAYTNLLSRVLGIEIEQGGIIFINEDKVTAPRMFTREELNKAGLMFDNLNEFYKEWKAYAN